MISVKPPRSRLADHSVVRAAVAEPDHDIVRVALSAPLKQIAFDGGLDPVSWPSSAVFEGHAVVQASG